MFDFLKPKRTTSLEKYREEQGYLKEKLNEAQNKGKARAETEAKQEKQQIKEQPKVKGMFEKFQDYAEDFAKQPSVFGDSKITLGGSNGRTQVKRQGKNKSKRSR